MNVYSQRLWILQEINLVRLALIVSGQSTFTTLSHPLAPLLPHDLPHLNHKRPLPILPRPLRPPPQNRPRNLTLKPRITSKPHHDILRRHPIPPSSASILRASPSLSTPNAIPARAIPSAHLPRPVPANIIPLCPV